MVNSNGTNDSGRFCPSYIKRSSFFECIWRRVPALVVAFLIAWSTSDTIVQSVVFTFALMLVVYGAWRSYDRDKMINQAVANQYREMSLYFNEWAARKKKSMQKETNQLHQQTQSELTMLARRQNEHDTIIRAKYEALSVAEAHCSQRQEKLGLLLAESMQSYPWMAQQLADFFMLFDESTALQLEKRARPAKAASESVKRIAQEKRELQKYSKMLEYQLNFYEAAFPWLEEFKELDPKQAWQDVQQSSDEPENEYEMLRSWLSPSEYQSLPNPQKYQLALERYLSKRKNNWEIGIDFERYIGYQYELNGYNVKYHGATMGLADMGRDLIASNSDMTIVIQCKRWAKEKTIHEKHIFQLYGSLVMLRLQNPTISYHGTFITTTQLSPVAKDCATYLNIEFMENYPITTYPMIKCNIAKSGEKIYHLPFDQQYDTVVIDTSRGECYAFTVSEAEALGFRRAFRWKGAQDCPAPS